MASWKDTINSRNPLLFVRMDEFSGTVMHDSSAYATHGTFFNPTFGLPSPIETDPSSFAIGGSVGKVNIADAPQSDIRGNFSIEVWGYVTPPVQVSHLVTRNGQIGLGGGNWIAIDQGGGGIRFTLSIGGSDYELNFIPPVTNRFYHIVGVRNGATMLLYVDGSLITSRSDLPPSTDISVGSSTAWYFGSSQNQNLWVSVGTDEAIIHSIALNAAQVLENYESAINTTLLNGLSNVIPSAIADGSDESDPIHFPFRHNWTNDLIERISFRTNISQAISGPEEAGQVRPKPRRAIEINQMLRNNAERRALRAKLWPNQHAKWFLPILEDREQISALASGVSSIPVSTEFKDYEIGSFVQIRELVDSGEITQSETIEITDLDANSVHLLTQTENDYAGIVEVCPARRGYLNISSLQGHTAEVEDLVITARLLAQDEKATPNRITSFTPALTYKGYEVFDESQWQSNDWSEIREYEIERSLVEVDFDSGVFGVESDTPGAQESFTYRIWIKGRALNASFLGWFYERAGSLNYLWVPSMQRDFEIVSVVNALVTVADTHYSDNYGGAAARRDLAFVNNDGSMGFRRVNAFAISGSNEVLTLDSNAPSVTNLRSLSLLKFCRLDADMLEIAKRSDDLWIYQWRFRELLESPS